MTQHPTTASGTDTSGTAVSPDALNTYAGRQSLAAHRVGAHAGAVDVGPLTMTFGVIGAEYLAALGELLGSRRRRLSDVTARHTRIGTETTTAANSYVAADTGAARTVARTDTPDTEVSA
ncbi:type VII secretion target [Gordonia sp. NPDC003376]